jgi:hypothetical protein
MHKCDEAEDLIHALRANYERALEANTELESELDASRRWNKELIRDVAALEATIDLHHKGSMYCGRCGWNLEKGNE